jgi:hypothetical protein
MTIVAASAPSNSDVAMRPATWAPKMIAPQPTMAVSDCKSRLL